jgi:hypothetical protein
MPARGALRKSVVLIPPVSAGVQRLQLDALSQAIGLRSSLAFDADGHTVGVLFGEGDRAVSLVSRQASELEYDLAMRLAARWIVAGDRLERLCDRSQSA